MAKRPDKAAMLRRAELRQAEFIRALYRATAALLKITEAWKAYPAPMPGTVDPWPPGVAFPISPEFREALADMKRVVDALHSRL